MKPNNPAVGTTKPTKPSAPAVGECAFNPVIIDDKPGFEAILEGLRLSGINGFDKRRSDEGS